MTNYLKALMLKYNAMCRFKNCHIPGNLERSKEEIVWKIMSDTLKNGSSDVKNNDEKRHIKHLYIIISGNVSAEW